MSPDGRRFETDPSAPPSARSRPVIAIVDAETCEVRDLDAISLGKRLLRAGAPILLYRERRRRAGMTWTAARALAEAAAENGAQLIVSDRVDVAAAVERCGVHLPSRGLPPDVARSLLSHERWIGWSAHDTSEAVDAAEGGVDYLTASPLRAPHSKPLIGEPLGLSGVAAIAAAVSIPVFALGGVVPGDAASLRAAGVAGCAVLGPLHVPEPEDVLRDFLRAWEPPAVESGRSRGADAQRGSGTKR